MSTQDKKVIVHRYEETEDMVRAIARPSIFLAGPTVRGHQPHLTSWRFAAIEEFERQGFDGDLIVPEFTSKSESDKGKAWIPLWEFNGLKKSDAIMFWIPRTRELIALTTNMEFGYWQERQPEKMIYGRPDDAYRMSYLDIMWVETALENKRYAPLIYNTLETTVAASIKLAYEKFNAFIPKDILDDMHFCQRLEADMGFMGSPDYDARIARIKHFKDTKKIYK